MPRPEPPRSTHSGKQPAHQSANAAASAAASACATVPCGSAATNRHHSVMPSSACAIAVREQNVGHATHSQLSADGDVPEQREWEGRGGATAAQHGLERGRRIEDGIDGAGLKSLIGLATFGDIHSGDLLDQTGEIAASQLTMDDGPYHASLPLRIRERQAWCRSSIWLFGNALR